MPRTGRARWTLARASALALGALVWATVPAATAGTTASVRHAAGYCRIVSGVQHAERSAVAELTTPSQAASAIKTAYRNFEAYESRVMSVVPSQLKGAYQTLFSAMSAISADLAHAGYDVSKLPAASVKSLTSLSSSMAAASNEIAAYDRQVCHVSLGGTASRGPSPTPTTPSGNAAVGGVSVGTKLPAGFPKSLPLPARADLVGQVSVGGAGYDLWLAATGSQRSVFAAYEGQLKKAGARIEQSGEMPGAGGLVLVAGTSAWQANVVVFPSGSSNAVSQDLKAGQVAVSLTVAAK